MKKLLFLSLLASLFFCIQCEELDENGQRKISAVVNGEVWNARPHGWEAFPAKTPDFIEYDYVTDENTAQSYYYFDFDLHPEGEARELGIGIYSKEKLEVGVRYSIRESKGGALTGAYACMAGVSLSKTEECVKSEKNLCYGTIHIYPHTGYTGWIIFDEIQPLEGTKLLMVGRFEFDAKGIKEGRKGTVSVRKGKFTYTLPEQRKRTIEKT